VYINDGKCTGSLHDAGVDKKTKESKVGKRAKQVAMALHLRMKKTNQDFIMMTAHVKSGDSKADIPAKKAQGAEVAAIIATYNKGQGVTPEGHQIPAMPVIFACDFNNKPSGHAHKSFFGKLPKNFVTSAYANVLQTWRCPAETSKPKGETSKGKLTHEESQIGKNSPRFWTETDHAPLLAQQRKLEKCVTCNRELTQEPEFTTSKWRKGGVQEKKRGITNQTIDYIFYTSKDFECTRVLNMPTKKIEPLFMPGWKYPSDHFCIVADLIPEQQTRPRGNAVSVRPAALGGKRRRRMAQREFSSRRDSPVMVRLLQEIVAAHNKHNNK